MNGITNYADFFIDFFIPKISVTLLFMSFCGLIDLYFYKKKETWMKDWNNKRKEEKWLCSV